MKTIWKYPLNPDTTTIKMPAGAQILDVQVQHETPCIWALVDPKQEIIEREFIIHGTGHDVRGDKYLSYIGTFQLQKGMLVFHLFEILRAKNQN